MGSWKLTNSRPNGTYHNWQLEQSWGKANSRRVLSSLKATQVEIRLRAKGSDLEPFRIASSGAGIKRLEDVERRKSEDRWRLFLKPLFAEHARFLAALILGLSQFVGIRVMLNLTVNTSTFFDTLSTISILGGMTEI